MLVKKGTFVKVINPEKNLEYWWYYMEGYKTKVGRLLKICRGAYILHDFDTTKDGKYIDIGSSKKATRGIRVPTSIVCFYSNTKKLIKKK